MKPHRKLVVSSTISFLLQPTIITAKVKFEAGLSHCQSDPTYVLELRGYI
jgi:hypothetical protein